MLGSLHRAEATPGGARAPRLRVEWLAIHPAHYMDTLFEAVARDGRFDLRVTYALEGSGIHPWRRDESPGAVPSRILPPERLKRMAAGQALARRAEFLVVNGWMEPTSLTALSARSLVRRPFAVWTDTPDVHRPRPAATRLLRDRWLSMVFRRARAVMGAGAPATTALAQMGAPSEKIVNFPLPVDLDAFSPRAAGRRPGGDTVVLAASGRLDNAHKGYDAAIEALGLVRATLGHCPFTLRIAGTGPDHEALLALTRRLGLTGHVEFVGWLQPPELPDFFRSADVFVHPSAFEPYGVAIIEAMACGVPVIGSELACAVQERLVPGVNGWVVPPRDPSALAAALLTAWRERDRLPAMGAAARRTAEQWPVQANVELLHQLVAGARAAAR